SAHRVVLFGGQVGDFFGDTWEWDGVSWGERNVTSPPPRRAAPVMATRGSTVMLFGGVTEGHYLADTWEWDGTAWSEKEAKRPRSARPLQARDGVARGQGGALRRARRRQRRCLPLRYVGVGRHELVAEDRGGSIRALRTRDGDAQREGGALRRPRCKRRLPLR